MRIRLLFLTVVVASACCFPIKPTKDEESCLDRCLRNCPPSSGRSHDNIGDDRRTPCEKNCMDRC